MIEIVNGIHPYAERLTDEQLRRLTEYVHPDEATDYVRPWLHSMAAELLVLRAYATDHEGRCNTLCPRCGIEVDHEVGNLTQEEAQAALDAMPASVDHDQAGELEYLRRRVTELEAAQRHSDLETRDLHLELQRARLEAAGPKITSETSDGYHTFAELYHYRMLYNAAAFNAWAAAGLYDVHKSWRHSDGELAFGGGWFVVYATLPGGQISNHYEAVDWDLFQIPERETAAEWDGHTPREAAGRLADLLDSPVAQREPIGYVVLAKRPGRHEPEAYEYATAGSIWPTKDPVENHQAHCEAVAEADPERYGSVEYVIAELREATQ